MPALRVGIVGAAGQTGSSVVEALLKQRDFEVVALVRPSSLDKPANKALQSRGVELRALDLDASIDDIATVLKNIEVLISLVGPADQLVQIPLATAAKKAAVKRFLPCAAQTVIPPGGINTLRDLKEQVYIHIKQIGLSYTIVDVGWWYQIHFPRLPSGKIDYAVSLNTSAIAGDGNMPSALTDLRDIGSYFARIIVDDRTINKYVLVYNEMWSQNQIFDTLSRMSGEDIPREYEDRAKLEENIRDGQKAMNGIPQDFSDPVNLLNMFKVVGSEYRISWGIRGDNTPEYAKFLGYLTSKELYPDLTFIRFEDYLQEVLDGKAATVYDELKPIFEGLKKK